MYSKSKKQLATTLDIDIIKEIKHFAVKHNLNVNDVLTLLWKNYGKLLDVLLTREPL